MRFSFDNVEDSQITRCLGTVSISKIKIQKLTKNLTPDFTVLKIKNKSETKTEQLFKAHKKLS